MDKVLEQDIIEFIEKEYWKSNLPQKIHCSVLSEEAVSAAIQDYKRRKNIL